MNQRTQPGFLAQERLSKALFGDHPRCARVADARGARRPDARRAGRIPQGALRARSRRARRRRRHHAGAGEGQGGSRIRRVEESRARRSRRRTTPAPPGRADDLVRRAAEFGADEPARRHAEHRAHRSRLRRADGRQPRARRRPDRPPVRAPARAEGLHLRRLQQLQRDADHRIVVGVHRRALRSHRSRR